MRVYPFLLIVPFLSLGCATVSQPKPGKITLEDALKSVGTGLALMKKAEFEANGNKEFITGLMPSEAEVVFNISASNSTEKKLYVELTPVSASPVQGKAGGSTGTSESVSRGNQITIKFRNIVFNKTVKAEKDGKTETTEGIIEGDKLEKFLDAVKKSNFIVYLDGSSNETETQTAKAKSGGGGHCSTGNKPLSQVDGPGAGDLSGKKR